MKTLTLIRDLALREYTEKLLEKVPEYFWKIGASSSTKYHPSYQLGEGGLLRHTEAMCFIAKDLFRAGMFNFTPREQDLILIAIIFHDAFKNGNVDSGHTVPEHPILAADFIRFNPDSYSYLTSEEINLISDGIETHMGRWNTDRENNEIMAKPVTEYQKFIHLCDYIGSRRYLDMDFNNALYILKDDFMES